MSKAIALFTRRFYFLRHGETESNAASLVAGSLDTHLTALGRSQARDAALLLADEPITAVYSSPLRRARDTATPIAETLKLPVVVIRELAERNWGALEGQPRGSRVRGVMPDGAEDTTAFTERILSGFAQVDSAVPLIVGHSGVFRVLCHVLDIVQTEAPVTNALPLRFSPLAQGWKLEPLARAD
jgi:probable phosphoglycerate mutase